MRTFFSNASASPERRAAVQNFAWLLLDRAVRLLLNVGVSFWVARHLGPARFGTLHYVIAVVAIVQPLAEMGLEGIVRREFVRAGPEAANWAAAALGLRLLGGLAAIAAVLLSLVFPWATPEDRGLTVVLIALLLPPALGVGELWLQAKLAARTVVLWQWLSLACGATARVILVAVDAPLAAFAIALATETALAAVLVWGSARRHGFQLGRWEREKARALLREGWPLLFSGFATLLCLRIDLVMLRRLSGSDAAGLYAAATRFTEIWFFVPGALAASVLPALLRAREQGPETYARRMQMFYDLNAALGYVLALLMSLASPWLVTFAYGSAFASGAQVLAVHAWSLVFVFLGVARGQFLINERQTGFYFASVVAGLLFNVVLNFLLIPRYGARGSAVAALVAQATAAWLSTFCFAPTRPGAWMQTRALLIPVRWFRYVQSA